MAVAMVSRTCKACRAQFSVKESYLRGQQRAYGDRAVRYCSLACQRTARANPDAYDIRSCAHCGTSFRFKRSDGYGARATRGQFCSFACKIASPVVVTTCAGCGDPFTTQAGVYRARPRKYCSKRCARVAPVEPVTLSCAVCAAAFVVPPRRVGSAKCCSRPCQAKYVGRLARRRTVDRMSRITTAAWKERRAEVLARDGHRCLDCGTGERLTVHHIVPWRETQDDRIENLVTLCRRCHLMAEWSGSHRYGRTA